MSIRVESERVHIEWLEEKAVLGEALHNEK